MKTLSNLMLSWLLSAYFLCASFAVAQSSDLHAIRAEIFESNVYIDLIRIDGASGMIEVLRRKLASYDASKGIPVDQLLNQIDTSQFVSFARSTPGSSGVRLGDQGWYPSNAITYEKYFQRVLLELKNFSQLRALKERFAKRKAICLENNDYVNAARVDLELNKSIIWQNSSLQIRGYDLFPFINSNPDSFVDISLNAVTKTIVGLTQRTGSECTYYFKAIKGEEYNKHVSEFKIASELKKMSEMKIARAMAAVEFVELKTSRKVFGFSLTRLGDDFVVENVVLNSPAAANGVRKGWRLLQVNGVDVTAKKFEEVTQMLNLQSGVCSFLFLTNDNGVKEIKLLKSQLP